eukprot:CAMPEP_0118817542 /NCGR_PEP_ID=MMETSP1162-20130426/5481_1 /TAXON_ID=33656 /ORGANISM="Phaeocystis Sp, Strain CCMP2710" /LENGTH=47 /DNA_ID= /DNA_START= /DNA_END= /DNA_ORIENTATION=
MRVSTALIYNPGGRKATALMFTPRELDAPDAVAAAVAAAPTSAADLP